MIDPELIKENYAQMPDEKLISVLKEDGTSITYEAFIILKREYAKRKLNPDPIAAIENKRQEKSKEKVRNNFERELNSADSKLWMEVFSQKAAGKTDGEIINWLINEGIEPEKAIDGIKDIEAIARNAYKKARKAMIASMLFIFGGLLLCGFSIQGSFNSTYLLYGVILFVTPLRFIYTNHKVYQLCEKVTEVLKGEKAEKN